MAPVIRNFAFLILLNISAVCAKDWRSKLHFAWTSHSGLAWVDKVRFLHKIMAELQGVNTMKSNKYLT